MAREDRYSAGLATGAGVAGVGALVASAGGRMRQQGRAQARANAGSRGQTVRGGRLVRVGGQMIDEGNKGLGQFRRVAGKNGKTVYIKPGGGFAPTKAFQSTIAQGKDTRAAGGAQISSGKLRRVKAIEGVGQMRRGRLIARGGVGAAALGGVAALGSVAAGERYRSRRARAMDDALRPAASKVERPASDYRAMAAGGGLLQQNGYPVRVSPKAASEWLRNAERGRV